MTAILCLPDTLHPAVFYLFQPDAILNLLNWGSHVSTTRPFSILMAGSVCLGLPVLNSVTGIRNDGFAELTD